MWSVKRNRLTIHPIKTEAMILRKSAFVGPLPPLYFGTGLINLVDSTTCLGVEIDNRLSWSVHIDSVKKHFTQKVGALKRMIILPKQSLEEIYFKSIIPSVTYSTLVWEIAHPPQWIDLFCLYILFSQYRSCDDTREIWSFVLFIKKSVFMLAFILYNEQDKGSIPLSIITWSVLGKQNVQAKKVYSLNSIHERASRIVNNLQPSLADDTSVSINRIGYLSRIFTKHPFLC